MLFPISREITTVMSACLLLLYKIWWALVSIMMSLNQTRTCACIFFFARFMSYFAWSAYIWTFLSKQAVYYQETFSKHERKKCLPLDITNKFAHASDLFSSIPVHILQFARKQLLLFHLYPHHKCTEHTDNKRFSHGLLYAPSSRNHSNSEKLNMVCSQEI